MPHQVTVEQRLSNYGVDAQAADLKDLRVAANQALTLDAGIPQLSDRVVRLKPRSVEELKKWFGAPAEAQVVSGSREETVPIPRRVTHSLPRIDALGTVPRLAEELAERAEIGRGGLRPQDHAVLEASMHDYIYRHKATVSPELLRQVDEWMRRIDLSVNIWRFMDVHVAHGATLAINNGSILVARYIYIEKDAKIVTGTVASIDCQGMKQV
jgi:hypothetical protein